MRVSIPVAGGFEPSTTVRAAMRFVYGTGTVIARMAHTHEKHAGPFQACRKCNGFRWAPAENQGVLVTAEDGQLVEGSDLARRLLLP
jgi:hypothetical protein